MFMSAWYVYILHCKRGKLYTGITTDLERRLREHNSSKKGAKFTRAHRPVALVYSETYDSRSAASVREHIIKTLTRKEKELLIISKTS